MPEIMSDCRRSEQLEELFACVRVQKKEKNSPNRGYDLTPGDVSGMFPAGQSPRKKARAKESSQFFGVRFRPDLSKWVAEIRVAEWKSVDKKVWLGTFDSEEGAARAVDAARKLLKCQKKRQPNFPCEELLAYSEQIPACLDLDNLGDGSMFKKVTAFVKRKAQEYAASFGPCNAVVAYPCLRDQLPPVSHVSHPYKIQVADGNRCFQLTSDMEPPRQLYALPEDDVSPSSYGSSGTQFSSLEAVMAHAWGSPSSVTYSGPPSCSSAGSSPPGDQSWVHVDSSMWTDAPLPPMGVEEGPYDNWVVMPASDSLDVHMPMPMAMDDHASIYMEDAYHEHDQYPFVMDDVPHPCHVHEDEQSFMNVFPDEMLYTDNNSNSNNWALQQSFNNIYNSLSSSLEYVQVC